MNVAIITFAIAGAAAGPILARLAALRSPHQPVDAEPAAELRVLAAVAADLSLVAAAQADDIGLRAEHFTSEGRRAMWHRLEAAAEQNADTDTATPVDFEGLEDVVAQLDGVEPIRDYDASDIVGAAEARRIYKGAGQVVENSDTDTLERVYERPSLPRQLWAAVVVALGFGFSAWAAAQVASGWAEVAAMFALAASVATGYMLSAIDHDTLTLDYVTLFAGGAVAWAAAAVQAYQLDDFTRLVHGVAATAVWLIVFTSMNFIYRLWRGIDGIGGGDWKIVGVCAAVPAAVAGQFTVGFWAVCAGMAVALVVRTPMLLTGRADRMTRLAMGPYIACGWPLAWLWVQSQGLIG